MCVKKQSKSENVNVATATGDPVLANVLAFGCDRLSVSDRLAVFGTAISSYQLKQVTIIVTFKQSVQCVIVRQTRKTFSGQ